jgi:hypothetical protein
MHRSIGCYTSNMPNAAEVSARERLMRFPQSACYTKFAGENRQAADCYRKTRHIMRRRRHAR